MPWIEGVQLGVTDMGDEDTRIVAVPKDHGFAVDLAAHKPDGDFIADP
jgi:hypothetical protein